MQKIKKWLLLIAYLLLVVLALLGIGIAGVPVPPQNKKEGKVIEINIEMLDKENEKANTTEIIQKN